jgi:D-alanyl-D-alanine carboxypeptidase
MEDLLSVALQSSSNFYAEVLGKLLGAATYGAPGTIASGAAAVEAWASGHGVSVRAFDSSGLSYRNRVSPSGMVRSLLQAQREPWGDELRAALPGPGEGTLNGRLSGLEVRAKTGSLFDGTVTLSGWLRPSGARRWLAFSIMSSDGGGAVDSIVNALDRSVARALRKT